MARKVGEGKNGVFLVCGRYNFSFFSGCRDLGFFLGFH